jgi:hypothetical protein
MAVNKRGRNLERGAPGPVNTDFNAEINSKRAQSKLSAADCAALVETIRLTPGWWAQQAGDLQHRYVFCWRWQEPQTAVLFCYDQPSWWALKARIEKALGLTK